MNRQNTIIVFVALVGLAVAGRLVPHAPNFAPVAASGLLAGYLFRFKALATAVPLLALLISDLLFAGTYPIGVMACVYAGLALPALLGAWLRKPAGNTFGRVLKLGGAALGSSIFFFLISNLGEWVFGSMYAFNATGLAACFAAALPFFKSSLAADLIYTGAFFGIAHLVATTVGKRSLAPFNA